MERSMNPPAPHLTELVAAGPLIPLAQAHVLLVLEPVRPDVDRARADCRTFETTVKISQCLTLAKTRCDANVIVRNNSKSEMNYVGRSRGGLSTKIHAAGDALGNPVRLIASPGQRNDIAFAHDLVDSFDAGATLADKGYDADHLCETIARSGAEVVIPPKRNRKVQRDYDVELYKERNIIERFFNKLKQFRRVATRYDKLLANFMGFVKLAAIAISLR
jgi:putative transposase